MAESEEQQMDRFSVDFTIANQEDVIQADADEIPREQIRQKRLEGVVDTGAARLVLPEAVAADLGLPAAGETTVRYADGRTATRNRVKYVWLELLGREGVFSATLEPDRDTALIGTFVLEELDLVVDCVTNALHPRDPKRIISEIE